MPNIFSWFSLRLAALRGNIAAIRSIVRRQGRIVARSVHGGANRPPSSSHRLGYRNRRGKPLASADLPDLEESNLIISILRTDSAGVTITHLSIPIISQFVRALCHYKAKWSMKRDECVLCARPDPARVRACARLPMSERAARGCGRYVLLCIWEGRAISRLQFYWCNKSQWAHLVTLRPAHQYIMGSSHRYCRG